MTRVRTGSKFPTNFAHYDTRKLHQMSFPWVSGVKVTFVAIICCFSLVLLSILIKYYTTHIHDVLSDLIFCDKNPSLP